MESLLRICGASVDFKPFTLKQVLSPFLRLDAGDIFCRLSDACRLIKPKKRRKSDDALRVFRLPLADEAYGISRSANLKKVK